MVTNVSDEPPAFVLRVEMADYKVSNQIRRCHNPEDHSMDPTTDQVSHTYKTTGKIIQKFRLGQRAARLYTTAAKT
jgi:hypothetical protein